MMLRLVIWTLRLSLTILLTTAVTLLFGRGRLSRRVLKGTRFIRRMGRL